jgi:hypothetical protein
MNDKEAEKISWSFVDTKMCKEKINHEECHKIIKNTQTSLLKACQPAEVIIRCIIKIPATIIDFTLKLSNEITFGKSIEAQNTVLTVLIVSVFLIFTYAAYRILKFTNNTQFETINDSLALNSATNFLK